MEWIYGKQVVSLALMPGARRRVRRIVGTANSLRDLGVDARALRIPVEALHMHALDELTGSREHQGIAAYVDGYPYAGVGEVLAGDLVVALDEVADPRNLGAVVRSALACGAAGLVISRHRSAAVTPAAAKASAGATAHLPSAQVATLRGFLRRAQQLGFWVYGAAGDAGRLYVDVDYPERLVLVMGSEGRGLRRLVAETCDELVSLPMQGPVSSLNVSVAAAVLLYDIRRRTPTRGPQDERRPKPPRPATAPAGGLAESSRSSAAGADRPRGSPRSAAPSGGASSPRQAREHRPRKPGPRRPGSGGTHR